MKRNISPLMALFVTWFVFTGCTQMTSKMDSMDASLKGAVAGVSATSSNLAAPKAGSVETPSVLPSEKPSETPEPKVEPTPTQRPTPVPTPPVADYNANDTGKTVIRAISENPAYYNNSYVIVSEKGTVVVLDPTYAVEGLEPDLILSTHSHPDHVDRTLMKKDCKIVEGEMESGTVDDVKFTGIASTHRGDTIDEASLSNVLFLVEVDGLRIVHMGDIGQTKLTDAQILALGKVDIAFMQFVNSYSNYGIDGATGISVIEQLKPSVIIPTHSIPKVNTTLGETVGALENVSDELVISADDLKDAGRKVIVIKNSLVEK